MSHLPNTVSTATPAASAGTETPTARRALPQSGIRPGVCTPGHIAFVPESIRSEQAIPSWIAALEVVIDGCRAQGVATLSVRINGKPCSDVEQKLNYALSLWIEQHAAGLSRLGVRIRCIGESHTTALAAALVKADRGNSSATVLDVFLATNYDGRDELASATQALAQRMSKSGDQSTEKLQDFLPSAHVPPVDLTIRTGGETRLSDFLLWQAAYAELLFVDAPWTAFSNQNLSQAFSDYARRRRTFGGLNGSSQASNSAH